MQKYTANREIRTSKLVKAPINIVWDVWISPNHLINWWGPAGFNCTIHKMDFQNG